MKPKFEIGDKVIEKEPCFGGYGYVTSINHYNDPDCYVVKFANGDERVSYIEDFCVKDSEIKTAFLTRLQELLASFDAKICSCAEGCDTSWIDVYFGEQCVIAFPINRTTECTTITAENVFDYDKD